MRHSNSVLPARPRLRGLTVLVGLALAGCVTIEPTPLTVDDLRQGTRDDRAAAQKGVVPISGPLSLEESLARALKYNLDRRVRMLEEAVALGTFEVGTYDMLPKVLAQAGYRARDEFLITRSRDSVTGLPSLANPSISSDRETRNADLGLTWNILDFGTSYFNARQNADRVLVAAERRRKAMHVLMQDVRTAFWRAAAAQKLEKDVREAIAIAEDALADARKAEAERVRSPIDSLRYQRQVLENLRLLETAQQELSTARIDLALLINAPVGQELRVADIDAAPDRRVLDVPIARLEEAAMERNADTREQFYGSRIAAAETRKVVLRMFPNLTFNYNARYDSNSFLVHKDWNEAGLSLSFNLLNLLSAPAQMKLAEAGVALADQRRMATQMATLAQVHIARLQFANALTQLERANEIAGIDGRINTLSANRESAQMQSKLESVSMRATLILSMMRRYQAIAQAYAADSRLQMTLGLEPEVANLDETPLDKLSASLRNTSPYAPLGPLPEPPAVKAAAVPLPSQPARASAPTPDELFAVVRDWAAAWSKRDVPAYLAFYDRDFRPQGGLDRAQWERQRRERIEPRSSISVSVDGLQFASAAADAASVSFRQQYVANDMRSTDQKTLVFVRRDGRWKIVEERAAP